MRLNNIIAYRAQAGKQNMPHGPLNSASIGQEYSVHSFRCLIICEPRIHLPAIAFGRASAPLFALCRRRRRSGVFFTRRRWRAHILIQRAGFGRGAAAHPACRHLEYPNLFMNHQRDDIAGANRTARFAHPGGVDAGFAGFHQPGCQCPGFRNASIPEPFVEALALIRARVRHRL